MSTNSLKAISLFEGLDEGELEKLALLLKRQAYDDAHLLFRQGDPADALYLIEEGRVAIIRGLDTEKMTKLATLGPGDFFGEMGILQQKPRGASAKCATACVMLALARDALLSFLAEHPMVEMKMRATMARRQTENLSKSFPR